jgi:NAD+ synthase
LSLADEISDWIALRVAAAGSKGAVVGLSGGIDSSVVAALCKRALGDSVLGTILPCQSQAIDEEYARLAAAAFGLATLKVDLTPVFATFIAQMPETARLANANVKSRLRMATNYYLANLRGYIVVGTGNRTELYIGYFTKYGDGGADILPIGGLLKRDVRVLARELGVPPPIVDRPPTAGLWPGQTDEGEIGMSYDELDAIVSALSRGDAGGLRPEAVERVRRLHDASEHKRALMPIFEPS